MGTIRYCKAEVFKECILGTLRIPEKSEKRECLLPFGFYMTDETLYLLEKTGNLKHWIEKHVGKWKDLQTPDQCLLQIIEQMIEHDILYLSHLEQEMVNMEDELAQWARFSLRTERLQNHVHLLRKNTLQLRELYQSRQDAQQNRIMCIISRKRSSFESVGASAVSRCSFRLLILSPLIPVGAIVSSDDFRGKRRAVVFLIMFGCPQHIFCTHIDNGNIEEYDHDVAKI